MKEIIYNITQQTAGRVVVVSGLDEELTKDNVLGIINKTQSQVLYTPVQAANMLSASNQDGTMTISLAGNVPSINKGDELLVKLYSDKEIDFSAFAKESTLLTESQTIQSAIQNIDLSSVEGKVDEVKQAVENIDLTPIESKVDEGVSTLSGKIDNIDLSAVENKVQEESAAIQNKLNNLNVKVDLSEAAKQGENQDATNTAIYALLSQFGESVLQEAVTIICNCAEDIAWEEYGIVITYADGTSQSLPMSENGTCSFSVKIGQEYSVQLPVIGTYIAPTLKTYTASTSSRQIYWSYVVSGVFGLDEFGRRYTLSQIEAMDNKSIIKYGGYTDDYLENSSRDDGSTGNGFMFMLEESELLKKNVQWSSKTPTSFSTELLPFINNVDDARKACNGEAYTRYIISEGLRTSVATPAASWCSEGKITINNKTYNGFLPASGQMSTLCVNGSSFSQLFNLLGLTPIDLTIGYNTSCQATDNHSVRTKANGSFTFGNPSKITDAYSALRIFDLPR